MDNLKEAIAEIIGKVEITTGEHDRCVPPNYYLKPAAEVLEVEDLERLTQAVLDIVNEAIESEKFNYQGAMEDLDALVAEVRKNIANITYYLDRNYPNDKKS